MPRLLALAALSLALCSCGAGGSQNSSGGNSTAVPPPPGTCHLTIVVTGNGQCVPGSGDYSQGSRVHLTATPELTYHVGGWSGTVDDRSLATENDVVMDSDKTVEVLFLFKTAQ